MRRGWVLYRKARVHWWLHLIGWVMLAVPVALLAPWWWLFPLGAAAFELLLTVAVLRVRRRRPVLPGRRGPDDSGGSAGVREPRRPLPVAGAGAAEAAGPHDAELTR